MKVEVPSIPGNQKKLKYWLLWDITIVVSTEKDFPSKLIKYLNLNYFNKMEKNYHNISQKGKTEKINTDVLFFFPLYSALITTLINSQSFQFQDCLMLSRILYSKLSALIEYLLFGIDMFIHVMVKYFFPDKLLLIVRLQPLYLHISRQLHCITLNCTIG